jgi:ankyrin repeat protein
MDANDNGLLGGEDSQEEIEQVDPRVYKPDLYAAAAANRTTEVLRLLSENVPPTYVHEQSGWTPLHWAAKSGNIVMLTALMEHGATAPYHRMVKKAKLKKLREARELEESKKQSQHVVVEIPKEETTATSAEGGDAAPEGEAVPTEESKGDATEAAGESKDGGASADVAAPAAAAESKDGTTNAAATTAATTEGGQTTNNEENSVSVSKAPEAKPKGLASAEEDELLAELEENEDDDDDYEAALERAAETNTNLLKNTPLLWACAKGHLKIVWLLLIDGYSVNDTDDMDNNALHLAATSGNPKVVQVIVDDGAYSTKVNIYKNLPIDMATQKQCRQLLLDAMDKGASMTEFDIKNKHETNIQKFQKLTSNLENAIKTTTTSEGIKSLQETIDISREAAVSEDLIIEANMVITKLEMGLELLADLEMVQSSMPIKSQSQFSDVVHKMEKTIIRAKNLGADSGKIAYAEELIVKCEMEFWIVALTSRLVNVTCAVDTDEHDMNRLKSALEKGTKMNIDQTILDDGTKLSSRLFAELGMSRALATVPTNVKLPLKEGAEYPEDYWGEDDIGHVVETEGYPHPPAETGEYIWEPSKSYTSLVNAINNIKSSYIGAEELGANIDICNESKTKLIKCEKDLKILKIKDENDKIIGIETTQKLCKKKPGKKK